MRASTGSRGMDELLSGGLPESRLYVISGPPGSGKTTFASQFITEGARRGEECVYVTMHETKGELIEDMGSFEFGFEKAMRSNNLKFLNLTSEAARRSLTKYGTGGGLRSRVTAMLEEMDIDRAVIDSTMLLKHFVDDPEDALTEFITRLKATDTTILLVSEMTDPTAYSDEHYLAHGVIFFHNFLEGGGMTRAVQVIKMRGTDIDCDMRAIEFTDAGIQVFPDRKVEDTYWEMYDEHFEEDWDSLTQEEAMLRAYALGVDAAFGIDHPEKLARLRTEFHRGLVQIAFDEGESRASDEITERGQEPPNESAYEFEPSEYDWEIWDELVTERQSDPEALEMVRVPDSRDGRPSSLDRPSLLDRPDSDRRETLRLPRFLLR